MWQSRMGDTGSERPASAADNQLLGPTANYTGALGA